jgi:hypothetical protein
MAMTREEKKLAEASRRTAREVFRRARRELSLDTWREPDIVIDGKRLSVEEAKIVREAIEGFYARKPIATPLGVLPVRDLVRGLSGGRFDRAPARAANVISFPSATSLR